MRRWGILMVVASTMLLIAACGGDDETEDPTITGMTKDQACAETREIQQDGQELSERLASGTIEMNDLMKQMTEVATRLQGLSAAVEPGELKDALNQWSAATQTQLTDPSPANQTATFDARDRVDDICGIPRGPRD